MEWSHQSNSGIYRKGGRTERRAEEVKIEVEERRSEKGKEKEEKEKTTQGSQRMTNYFSEPCYILRNLWQIEILLMYKGCIVLFFSWPTTADASSVSALG